MARQEKAKKKSLSKTDTADIFFCNLPNITLYGTVLADVDNFKGLLDFSPQSVRINTTDGIVRIDGEELCLSVMTDENISVKGIIKNLSFE